METASELGGFTWIDWSVVAAFLALATWVGHRKSGHPQDVRDFFLGGRRLPWYAVAASIIATEISAVTLVGLPAVVFREGGDLTYLQLGVIGSFIARWLIAAFLVPAYFEREIYSPYDYMGERLGARVRGMTTALFALGGVLAQSARVYLVAVVLEVILVDELGWIEAHTGLPPLVSAVAAIGAVAVVWTWMGGIATVIWTDAILFLVFLAAIAIMLITVVVGVDGGAATVASMGADAGKLRFWSFDASPAKAYTVWTAIFAVSWGNVGAYGTDQLLVQRLLCCRDVRGARRAIMASYGAMIVTVLVGLVGVGLYAWYQQHPLSGRALALFEASPDRILPIFILQAIPVGLKGLIIAGIFAAAISSLDSILAALSQTVLSAFWLPRRPEHADPRTALRVSRVFVGVFGVLLCALAVFADVVAQHYPSILDLALAMAGYTQGALLAGFLLAFLRLKVDGSGYLWSAPLSVLAVFAVAWSSELGLSELSLSNLSDQWVAWTLIVGTALLLVAWGLRRVAVEVGRGGGRVLRDTAVLIAGVVLVLALGTAGVRVAWPWYVPVGGAFAFTFGWALAIPPRPSQA